MTLDERAQKAAQLAGHVSFWLHGAELSKSREDKRAKLIRAFTSWRLACQAISDLEGMAPNCATEGYEKATDILAIADGLNG